MNSMENYSPYIAATGESLNETTIAEFGGVPQTTTTGEEDAHEELPQYMAPKTIEVKRYRLKK